MATDSVLGSTGARLVDIALSEGSIFTSDGWKHIESTFENGTVHFIGLASDGGVHSRLDQVQSLQETLLIGCTYHWNHPPAEVIPVPSRKRICSVR